MASALQKFFRKRISKQQLQEQRQKQETVTTKERIAKEETDSRRGLRRLETSTSSQPYLTVRSLNSHSSSSTSYFPFSSKLSLESCSALDSIAGHDSAGPAQHDSNLTRESSSTFSHEHRPRASSMSAPSMLRDYSSGGGRIWRNSTFSDNEPQLDQFGSYLTADRDGGSQQAHLSPEGEEGDLEANPLYNAFSLNPKLQKDWNMAKLVLVPCKQAAIAKEELENEEYVALHALTPSNLFKDQFASVRSSNLQGSASCGNVWSSLVVTATLETESRSVHLLVTKAAAAHSPAIRFERSANVLGETTVYRSMTSQEASLSDPLCSSPRRAKRLSMSTSRRDRVRIRVLTIDGPVIPSKLVNHLYANEAAVDAAASQPPSKSESRPSLTRSSKASPGPEGIAFPVGSPTLDRAVSDSPQPVSPLLVSEERGEDGCQIPSQRQFCADFAFVLDPPRGLHQLKEPLKAGLETLVRAAKDFTNAYVYVSGFDAYNVSRIRRGILSKAWQAFESSRGEEGGGRESEWPTMELGSEGRARLLLLLENVVMGHCHGKIYSSIRIVNREADQRVDNVICTYQELQVSLEDLGPELPSICKRPAYLERAIFIMKHLGDAEEDMEHLLESPDPGLLRVLARQGSLDGVGQASLEFAPEKNRGRLRTPLDVLDILHATLEEIGQAIAKAQKAGVERTGGGTNRSTLGTDELLPILAYVIICAGPMKLVSLLYYVRQFGLSDAVTTQLNWALVTHDAVIDYLRKDPLGLCASNPLEGASQCQAKTPALSVGEVGLERSTSGQGGKEKHRARRTSLPGTVMLSPTSSDFTEQSSSKRSLRASVDLPSSASLFDLSETASTEEGGFKVPGRPASAYGGYPRGRVLSALDAVGEDGSSTESKVESSLPSLHSNCSSSHIKRTTSLSGSGELLIRPQIVVRPRKQSQACSTLSADAARDGQREESDRVPERTFSLGGRSMNRTSSEQSSALRGDGGSKASVAAVNFSKHNRRKSLDSWTSFSFFGGASSSSLQPAITSPIDVSPSNSSQGFVTSPPPLSSPPSTWLSSWTSDWSHGRREVSPGGCSDAESRPPSIISNDGIQPPIASWSLPRSSSSNSNLASNSNPNNQMGGSSLGSIKLHDSNNTISDLTTTTVSSVGTAKKTASIRSNSSSTNSHHQSRSDDSHPATERRHKSSRSRLLSVSSPTEPLPPRLYPESAAADYFQLPSTNQQHPLYPFSRPNGTNDGKPSSPASQAGILSSYSDFGSPLILDHQQLTPRYFSPDESSAAAAVAASGGFFSPSFGKIDIPSPVDEMTDPMTKTTMV